MSKREVRHGDIELVRVTSIPEGAQPKVRVAGSLVLAEGEATGHAHIVKHSKASLVAVAGALYLRVVAESLMEHDEHGDYLIPVRDYAVRQKRQYDEMWGQRYVAD
ncbi:MAG: hypothetical protein ACYTBJ_00330 [Planctomycetota bacterium]